MNATQSKIEELLVMLQCCHSVLTTAWARPGYPSLAGAGAFISTNVFKALQNADDELLRLFQDVCQEGIDMKYGDIWKHCHQIISTLRRLENNSLHPSIDPAFNLLYLATGVLYQEIAANMPVRPKQDKRFATVEDIAQLVSKCQWNKDVQKDLTQSLYDSLEKAARDLSKVAANP